LIYDVVIDLAKDVSNHFRKATLMRFHFRFPSMVARLAACLLSATFALLAASAQAQTSCAFNVDGSGALADALRDGVVLSRYAAGVRDANALVAGTGANSAAVLTTISGNLTRLDVDGSGAFDRNDAAIILRLLFNFNTNGAPTVSSTAFATAVRTYSDSACVSTSLLEMQRASKFLVQASFGPSMFDINAFHRLPEDTSVSGSKHKRKASRWINNQLATPRAQTHFDDAKQFYDSRCVPFSFDCGFYSNVVRHSFWKQAITGPDQLRQRLAFALSQILVVSDKGGSNDGFELAAYLDFLNDNAFGNYRDIVKGVVRSPAMSRYLNHLRNDGSAKTPNENFAREMLQLFSVGLVRLNADGTPVAGNTPTYSEEVVKGFARTFTGLSFDDRRTNQRCLGDPTETLPAWYWQPDRRCYPESDTTDISDREGWRRPLVAFVGYHSAAPRKHLQYDASNPGSADARCSASVVAATQNITSIPVAATGDGTRVSIATADAMLDAAVTNIFCHPNVGPFIGKQLIRFFVTSTPSPAYVARVSAAFNNNGSGVRGDMRAVIRAVLLDDEALDSAALPVSEQPKYGKLREPILRLSHILRAFPRPTANAPAFNGRYFIDGLDSVEYGINQGPLQSPSVFNFYHPEFSPPGPVQRANATAPEFEITTTTSIAQTQNVFGGLVAGSIYGNPYADFGFYGASWPAQSCDPYATPPTYADCLFLDYGEVFAKVGSTSDMIDYVNLVLLGGKLPASAKATYVNAIDARFSPNFSGLTPQQLADRRRERVRVVLWFAVHAPEFQTQY
jgi:uncharacterized protein (DUF1800 family)